MVPLARYLKGSRSIPRDRSLSSLRSLGKVDHATLSKSTAFYRTYKEKVNCLKFLRKLVFVTDKFLFFIEGIPSVIWFGKESNRFVLVMELLERNLETVFSQEG